MSSTVLNPKSAAPNPAGRRLADALMLVTTVCWAGNNVAGKEALSGFAPLALAQVRVILSAVLLCVLAWSRAGRLRLPSTARQWFTVACLGLTGITLNQVLYIDGLSRTSAVHAGLIVALGPVAVLALSIFRGHERFTFLKAAGMFAAFAGVGLLVMERAVPGREAGWLGDLIVLSGSLVFAWYTILVKEAAGMFDDLTVNALAFGLGAFLMLPVGAGAALAIRWQTIPLHAWMGMVYMAVCGSVIGYVIFGYALRHLPASHVAAFTYLQPVIAAALAVWLVNERITVREVTGGLLIIGGMYLTRDRLRSSRPGSNDADMVDVNGRVIPTR